MDYIKNVLCIQKEQKIRKKKFFIETFSFIITLNEKMTAMKQNWNMFCEVKRREAN